MVKDKNELSIAMSQSTDQDDEGKIIEQQSADLPSHTTVHQEVSKNAIYNTPTGTRPAHHKQSSSPVYDVNICRMECCCAEYSHTIADQLA